MNADDPNYAKCPKCGKFGISLPIAIKQTYTHRNLYCDCGHKLCVTEIQFCRMVADARRRVLQTDLMMLGIIPSDQHKAKPKVEKKAFFKMDEATYEAGFTLSVDNAAWLASQYWRANPGSILEIVVRKPVK